MINLKCFLLALSGGETRAPGTPGWNSQEYSDIGIICADGVLDPTVLTSQFGLTGATAAPGPSVSTGATGAA